MSRRAPRTALTGLLVALVVLVAAAWWALGDDDRTDDDAPAGAARVVQVIDGDTLVLEVAGRSEHVRLLGIDTPETHHPTKPVECFGAEAAARLAELVPVGTTVLLERDVEARDHYGRLLAYVHVGGDDGREVFVNAAMVADGYAVALPVDPNRAHRAELAELERSARASGAGLWGACGGPGVAVDAVTGR